MLIPIQFFRFITLMTLSLILASCNKGVSTVDTSLLPKISLEALEVTESATVRVPVRLSARANEKITIEYTTVAGTATQGIDYTAAQGVLTIEPGEDAGFVEVVTVEDTLNEVSETFKVVFTNVTNALIEKTQVEVTILDNDAMPTLSVNDVTVNEGDNVTLTFTLNTASDRDISLDFETQNISAVNGADYNSNTKTGFIIPKGQTTASVSLSTIDDLVDEIDETFKLVITNSQAVNVIDSTSIVTITDNDAAPAVSISDASVTEGSNASITVSLSQVSGKVVTFNWATTVGTAAAPADFFAGSGTAISIPAGTSSVTLFVTVVDDTITEVSENFTATISSPTDATIGNATANITLVDNDVIPTVSVGAATATEGGNISFPVTLSAVSGLNVSVNYATANSTAIAPGDYTAGSSTLTIPAGSASGNIIISTNDDILDEAVETFSVTISAPVNATLGTVTATATINDNDAAPAMSIDDVTATEGGGVAFTVSLSSASQQDITFDWATSDNTAIAASDFNVNSGSVTIPAGSTTSTLNITTIQDASFEVTEAFRVLLSNVVNATLADNTGIATINDNDTAPVITIDDVVVTEGVSAVLTVTLTGATSQTTTLNWTTVNGTALAPSDYTFQAGALSFAPGETTKTVTVVTIDDVTDEANQIFTISLSSPTNATISDATGQVTLTDNDASPTLSVADLTVTEGGVATFNINLSAISEQNVTVDWATLNGTALSGSDYTAGTGTATILAGATGTTVNVTTTDDVVSEVSETFSLNISNPANATISDASGLATITDNEGTPVLTISDVSVVEGAVASFTVTSSATSSQNITVDYATVAGTALSVSDFTAATGTATITAGTLTTTISVTTIDNALYEATEGYTVSLTNAVNANITDGTGAGTITDNDPQPSVSIDDVTVAEGTSAVFTVTLSTAANADVTIAWSTANNTAASPGDYTSTSGNLIIPSGSLTGTISITTINDAIDENAESFNLNLTGATNGTISDTQGVATLNDDDAAPNISISDVIVTEGSNAIYTVTLDTPSGKAVTFNWATADGTAVTPEDYVAASSSGTIAIGATTTTVTVTTTDDSRDENNDETFDVNLSGVVNAAVTDGTGTTTLSDNDTASLSINDVSVVEGGNLVFTVTSDRPSVNTVTVNWTTATGTALNVADFTADTGTATITAGTTTTTVTVATVDNAAYEIAETMTVLMSGPTNGIIGDASGAGTINDNDTAPTLSIDDVTTTESGNLNFTVTLTGSTEVASTFSWAATSGTATVVTDFPTSSGTGTIPAGSSTTSIVVSTLDDALNENDETLNVTLTSPANSTLLDNIGVGTIQDNDGIPVINIAPATSVEAASATFVVSLTAVSGRTVTVAWATSSGTATSGSDFTSSSGTVTFLPGVTSQNVVVPTIEDAVVCEGNENYSVTLSGPSNGTLGTSVGTGTITDNDPTLSIAPVTVVEGVTAGFVVTQSAICSSDVTFNWTTTAGTATSPADFTADSSSATILAGATTATVNIATTTDATPEVTEAFTVTISAPVNATIVTPTATGTITDDDAIPDLSISDITETEGTSLVFTVTSSVPAGTNITFSYASSGGTATSGTDFTATSGTGTITAGNTTTTITVPSTNDTIDELASETMTMTISAPNLGNIVDNTGVGTISDNDATPSMTIDDVTIAEGGNLVFTVNLNRASYQDITFDYVSSDLTTTVVSDYSAASGTGVTIAAGSTTQTISIAAIDDPAWEPSETMRITLSNAANANIVDSIGIGTITENDSTPTLAINDVTVVESGTATFTVTMNKIASQDVTFNWATAGATAISGTDFTANSGAAVVITAGTTTVTFDVETLEDALYEVSETYNVTLSGATIASIADATGVGTITDNDSGPTLAIDDPASVVEGNTITFTITQSLISGSDTTVAWATSSGTATSGSDFTAASGTATITAGQTTTTVVVTSLNDTVVDPSDETFTVTLSSPSGATLSDATGIGTIVDNEPARLNQALVSGGNVTSYKVSPDGAKAVYISDAEVDSKFEIYSVNTDGTTRTKLNSALVSGGNVTSFAISADSSKVVFIADLTTDEVYELYSVNTDGTGLLKISAAMVSGGDVDSFLITPDSSNVVYFSDKDVDAMSELFQVAIGGGASTQVSDTLVAAGDVTQYAISANSSRVIYIADRDVDEDFELFSATMAGGASTQLNNTLVAGGDISNFLISDNSASVVFIGDSDVDNSVEIYSVSIAGGTVSDLNGTLIAGGNVLSFKILPDSTKVIYIADADVDNDNEIFSVNMAGTGLVQLNSALTAGGDVSDFLITKSSSRVIYRADQDTDGKVELYSVTPAGASLTKISATLVTGGNVTDYAISDNSTNVVYLADVGTDETFELYTTSTTAATSTKISGTLALGGDVTGFQISADSSKVLFRADGTTNDVFELYKVNIGGSSLTKVNGTLPSGGNITSGIISDNNTKIIYLGDQITDAITELFGVNL